ncbi:tRNA/rRNA methyltransferase SpoU [Catenovulum agarivorans DS-2]|uniref:tRNA (cytidine(34)-2'-O)-methyltransferase n=1 Tax=Catenovulum agarivorans DS-2 TaxID=1328313 RepID=W7QVM3_9ALTE|nr:tRNA (cytidine(34)-2'-O)-methyltransferase [Catenovulum agarivorans]EWH11768.1 tRNA/rRNA methyltransferase SpoU [Catenovulum agarivorans DS-2]
MLHIALFEPQIAPNTGNIIRLAANNGFKLHLIEPLGFSLDEKQVRRAGLDYHDIANLTIHKNYADFVKAVAGNRIIACTTRGTRSHTDIQYQAGDVLLFGAETHGLSEDVHQQITAEHKIRIPMVKTDNNRSLNLSNSVAIISYEAWRQLDFLGGE